MVLSLFAFIFKWLIEYLPGLWSSFGFGIKGCTKGNKVGGVRWDCADALAAAGASSQLSTAQQTAQLHSRQG